MKVLARLVAGNPEGCVKDQKRRVELGILEGWVSIAGNIVLFIIKLLAGLAVGSAALIADAVHTLSDSASSVVVLLGFRVAGKPSDSEHPFGHGRMEYVATLIVAVLLFVAGFEMALSSWSAISSPSSSSADWWIIALIASTVIVKELMARFSEELGTIIESDTLVADAKHHRSDAISTLLVLVALISTKFGYPGVDGYMGMLVSLMIFLSGYDVAKGAVDSILGTPPSEEILKSIDNAVSDLEEILGIHDIICHNYGNSYIISLHIEVSSEMSALALHTLSERAEKRVEEKTGGTVVVHVDPVNNNHPEYSNIKKALNSIVERYDSVRAAYDVRVIGEMEDSCTVITELKLTNSTEGDDDSVITHRVKSEFRAVFPEMDIVLKLNRNPGVETGL